MARFLSLKTKLLYLTGPVKGTNNTAGSKVADQPVDMRVFCFVYLSCGIICLKKWHTWIRIASIILNKKSAESDVAPVGIKSYKFLFVLKKIYFAVFKKLIG